MKGSHQLIFLSSRRLLALKCEMPTQSRNVKKILILTLCSSVTIVVFIFICLLNKAEQNKIHQEHRANAISQFRHDPVIQGQLRDYKVIADCVGKEKDACDRLHLPRTEYERRIDAVYKAGMAEEARVRATQYRSPFEPPQTD